ncbi:MAG: polymorphic toxin type 4 domain-containing protein [Candidatus Thiodiazotropha lotti]|uniref:Polymorphic toxin type 4 domain-containing protein n=1 Tax=Candidatus Thiodiazotropha lotti TaxID=2792787 RepID=A0A9E4K9J8_9GAMM|nr:polymorphic toxin type 4 domain-containing protein [Candidatus Thiodiazotropha lotti]MCW4205769.1 polymorphic toxin type 4 domain-containing protein [Candidatus Thiodiazotropha lotti]
MAFIEGTSRDALGDIVIRSKVKSPPGRLGYEKMYWPGVEVGLQGWERAHSQGNITGHESPHGIRYAPREVNQHFQRLGIEKFIQELYKLKADDVDLWLTTVTSTHTGTLRLKEIQYRVDVVRRGQSKALFEASIEVENKKSFPKISVQVRERHSALEWQRFIS